jgi:hypothetical protein
MRPQDFVRMCRDAVQRGLKEYIETVVSYRLAHRGGSAPDREVLTLDPPVRHVERAHLGHVGPVLRRFRPDEHVLILDEERRR